MTTDQAKQVLVDKIVGLQGLKATELATEVAVELQEFDVPKLLDELVAEKRIIEIQYTLPDMNWRHKSFYFPAGTYLYTDQD